jgi:hypothetical protein
MQPQKKSIVSKIVITIIVIALAVVAFYIWGGKLINTPGKTVPVSASDDVNSLEADLGASSYSSTDFSDIQTELDK